MSLNTPWVSIRIRPRAERDRLVAALFDAGVQGIQEVGDELLTHVPEREAEAVVCALLAADAHVSVVTTPLPHVDWSEQWKEGLGAQQLGQIVVCPPWLAGRFDPARTVVIDPGMAFGTGDHATTRGIIRLMQDVIRDGDSVADLGAGSGVLSIAAAKLGAARVAAIEIDSDAIGNAEENVRTNGVSDRVAVIEGDGAVLLPLVAPVQVVLANIISSVLLEVLPVIGGALDDGGHAILSGILQSERHTMLRALTFDGWRIIAERTEDAWWSATIAR